MQTYLVFIILGYNEYKEETDMYLDTIELQIIAKTEKVAMKKAKELTDKKYFRLTKIIEKQNGT